MAITTARKIGVGEVRLSINAKANVLDVLDNNRLSYGPYTRRFESEFARIHNRTFACFMNSGTSALQVGLAAMKEKYGWHDGDKVLVPALTFVASLNVILQNNLVPVLVDIRLSDYGMDPQLAGEIMARHSAADDGNLVAIMPVHLFGRPSSASLQYMAKIFGLKVITDSCETMFIDGCADGDVSCFSTYACHIINTGVGGLATTNDPELASLIRSYANHGRDGIYTGIDDALGQFEVMNARFRFDRVGFSYRATELEAAIGCAELEDHQSNIDARRANAAVLIEQLHDLPLVLPRLEDSVHMMFPVLAENRDALTEHLENNGVETRPMLPLTNQPYLKQIYGAGVEDRFPVAQDVNRRGFYVGSHPYLSQKDLNHMADAFGSFFV